ncbi:MAG: acyl carrier protein [Peptococcaceae bacterium]|jgi:acyl carrier protein|nr:acyl carrier protein [Peptococcaceae bacterium]MDR2735957.1 acyl carrier protein [Gracilibacteraceae bacterium]
MEAEIISFISQLLNLPEEAVRPDSHLINDLGMSSLDIMQLASVFEERYGIEVNENDIIKNLTVGRISHYFGRLVPAETVLASKPASEGARSE